jgi:hypothetical protein
MPVKGPEPEGEINDSATEYRFIGREIVDRLALKRRVVAES